MNHRRLSKFGSSQGVGQEIIKVIETNELVRWKAFDPKTREYSIALPDGIATIHESKITKEFTIQEEMHFLQNEHSRTRTRNFNAVKRDANT